MRNKKFFGIHSCQDGIWVQAVTSKNYEDAFEMMERNDSNLIVLTKDEVNAFAQFMAKHPCDNKMHLLLLGKNRIYVLGKERDKHV